MCSLDKNNAATIDVIVIGAGPAGLSAATKLKSLGVKRVVVLEREARAGGIPRHCGHPPFGFREFTRVYTGPKYAAQLVKKALSIGVEIRTGVTVVEMQPNANLLISDNELGLQKISATRVLFATGVRETPRSARLVSGKRPQGVINTGALQSMVYLGDQRPFKKPVIVGTELVSFSSIQTCRHAKIKPVAMIEESNSVTAYWPSSLFAKFMGVTIHRGTRIVSINGDKQVESVTVLNTKGVQQVLNCDGIIFTGRFTPESSLARSSHLAIDAATGGPVINQFGQCSDPSYFAAGNVLRAVETAGWSWDEGRQIAEVLGSDEEFSMQESKDEAAAEISIVVACPQIKYCVPQKLRRVKARFGLKHIQLRFHDKAKGDILVKRNGQVLWKKSISTQPERRVLIPIDALVTQTELTGTLEIHFIAN